MTRICLVGTGVRSRDLAPYDDPDVQIWTIARGRDIPKRVDRLFEMHVEELWDGYGDKYAKELYHDSLRNWEGCRIFMQKDYPDIQMSVEYPKEKVLACVTPVELGATLPYQTSQVSWQLSLAIYEIICSSTEGMSPHGEILLYGYDLISEGESRSHQRHAVEYYIGLARGMDIKVTLPAESTLCKHTRDGKAILYGYDYPLTRDEAVIIYGHPMRQILSDKDGKPIEIRSVPGVMGMPMIGEQGKPEMKVAKVKENPNGQA